MKMVAIFTSLFVSTVLPFFILLSDKHSKAAQEKARARRLADAKMNARLLRFNL